MEGANYGIAWEEFSTGEEFDFEREAILVGERFIDDELDGDVPCGVSSSSVTMDVGGGGLWVDLVAGD
ncbi:hypothetical protein MTR_2g035965 [Medicago truncatula]|uniref:Uncharacterized protein n=1 Tax=Medicago truncatula TaxID=3880 RepID=A0A072V7R9_MEDTR|nr:hypothetical protein MTR_2g035965 [Medicago truncatula]